MTNSERKFSMLKVGCVGIAVADVMVPVSGMPNRGELARVDSVTVHNGGNAATAAINLSKLGVDAKMIGKVGDDLFGKYLCERLSEYGVDTAGLKVDKETQTSVSVVIIDKGAERSFLHCVGANGTFCEKDIDFSVIDKCDLIFVTGSFLLDSFDGEPTARFLKKCKELGKTTFLDVCFDAKGRWGELLSVCFPYIDYFMPSIDEACLIAKVGNDPDDIADEFMKGGVKNVIIKMGSKGSYLRLAGEERGRIFPSVKGIVAKDTTGAGDSFCSGFLAAYARGMSETDCMQFANATGALCVTEKGATTGIRSFEETLKFMDDKK